jgi:hypothetical protein
MRSYDWLFLFDFIEQEEQIYILECYGFLWAICMEV